MQVQYSVGLCRTKNYLIDQSKLLGRGVCVVLRFTQTTSLMGLGRAY